MLKTVLLSLLLAAGLPAQNTFWSTSTVPTVPSVTNDSASVTLGLPFYASVTGQVIGGRFYKGANNPGPHTVALFNSSGKILAQGTTQNESTTGWKTVLFASPVTLTASAKYVIAYLAPRGGYADDQNYAWKNLNRPPLHVTSLDSTSSSATYAYGASLSFPTGKWNRSNYWVDVLFQQGTSTTPPPVTYSISGTVNGTYAATLSLSGAATQTTGTDSTGHYTFSGLANGSYTITPSESGYVFTPTSASATINGANLAQVDFTSEVVSQPPPTSQTGVCHAVGPTGAGNGSGSDWNNRLNKLPATLIRGDIYYLMDGSYGSYTLNTPNSGTTRVTIKKAQSYDYGRSTDGCTNDISAGWNATIMGASQSRFQNFDSQLGLHYVTLDGNGRSTGIGCGKAPSINGAASDCGIFLGPVAYGDIGYAYWGSWNNGQTRNNNWTVRYVEGQGGGDANTSSGAQGEDLTCRDGCDNLLWERSYLHDASCDYVKIPWSHGATWRYNFFQRNNSNSSCHGQLLLSEVDTDNIVFYSNILEDITGTSIWSTVTGGQNDGWLIYNNIIERPQGSTRPGPSQGIISCVNTGNLCTNFQFIGNTIVNATDDYSGHLGMMCLDGKPCTATWRNNLYYNTSNIGYNMNGGTLTEDNNTFLNSGSVSNYYSNSTDVILPSGIADPFINWTGYDFRLSTKQTYLENGAMLTSPFNVDLTGQPRPGSDNIWNRGAYEYGATQP